MTTYVDRTRQVRVLIADMSPLISCGIAASLGTNPMFETQRCTIERLLAGEHDASPAFDVLVIESEPGMRLTDARLRKALPESVRSARIFVISQSGGERDIRCALESGIQGYATLTLTLDELQEGVRMVARGMRYVCPRSARRLADSMTREQLTARESDVLGELTRGRCNKTIAQELDMALGTVKAHVKTLMSKLDAKTRTQVVTVAIARGLVELDGGEVPSVYGGSRSFGARRTMRNEFQMAA